MTTLQELTSLDARHLSQLLTASDLDLSDMGEGGWLTVVQLLTSRLTEECEVLSADDWMIGSAAIEYALVRAEVVGYIDHDESVIRRLNLTAALLQRVSPNGDVEILDPRRMYQTFTEAVPFSAEEARSLSADWRTLDVSIIRRLRLAKNLVSPMLVAKRVLADDGLVGDMDAWEEVFPLLP
jgi:hypothetical protein